MSLFKQPWLLPTENEASGQRDEILCARFASEVSIYAVNIFVFLDEIGTDRRDILRRYGYSWRGMPAKANKLLVRGEHLVAVAFMSTTGVLDCKITHQTINGDLFYNIVQGTLLPHLMPYDGFNPHSIIVMDNPSIHHCQGISDMINGVGALLMYFPPYSPD